MDRSLDLAFFCVLGRKGNLSSAARELGLTPSAVSKRLAQLERRLGVRLMHRTTRRVTLTDEGELYYAAVSRILNDIEDLERIVASSAAAPRGLLRILATFTFGRLQIAPLVSDFVKRYPEVRVQLQLTDAPIELSGGDYDVGIRFGEVPDARLVAHRIARNERWLCASPAYLARAGVPRAPADLARHNCILLRQDQEAYGAWRFRSGRRTETVKVHGSLSTNDPEAALHWALDGHGIVVRSQWDVERYVREKRLRRILADCPLPGADIYAIYPERHKLAPRVRAFVDFLAARFGA
jgi:DNA-binding transcriptional LysR family regulator